MADLEFQCMISSLISLQNDYLSLSHCAYILWLWNVYSPVNLLDEFEHRWSYAIAFGAITTTILDILTGGQYLDLDLSPIGTGHFKIYIKQVTFSSDILKEST